MRENYERSDYMKNLFKIFEIIVIVAVIVFSMATCSGGGDGGYEYEYVFEETSGRLTITNIDSKYEGKYLLAPDRLDNLTGYTFCAGEKFSFVDDDPEYHYFSRVDTGGRITNGSVTLKVWKTSSYFVNGRNNFYNYIGNDKNITFNLYIFDKQTITEEDWVNKTYKAVGRTGGYAREGVNFTDGIGVFDATNNAISDY
jgi:hypothetical protein